MGLYTGVALDNVTINSGTIRANTLTVSGNAPVTKTASFTVGANESHIICNGAGSITVTLPTAASNVGRVIFIKTIAAQTVVSASSNVQPANSATAGTAILAATAGAWAMLVCNGTNWVIMAS
jgi:hypothetical protein